MRWMPVEHTRSMNQTPVDSHSPNTPVPNVAALRTYFERDTDLSGDAFDEGVDLLIDAARARLEGRT